MGRMKLFITLAALLMAADQSFAARQALNENASPSSKGGLNSNFSKANANFVETYAALDLKSNISCFAGESAFNGCFGLDWQSIDASGFNGNLATTDNTLQEIAQKVDDLVLGSGTTYTAGPNITISPENVISATGTLSGTVDWGSVTDKPTETPISASIVTALFPGNGDCLGKNGQAVDCGAGSSSYVSTPPTYSDEACTAGRYASSTSPLRLYSCLGNKWVYIDSTGLVDWNNLTPTISYVVDENFTTGSAPSGWTAADANRLYNYTPAIDGTYSFSAIGSNGVTTVSHAALTNYNQSFTFKVITLPASFDNILRWTINESAAANVVNLYPDGSLIFGVAGVSGSAPSGTLVAGETYDCEMQFISGAGAGTGFFRVRNVNAGSWVTINISSVNSNYGVTAEYIGSATGGQIVYDKVKVW